MLYLHKKKFRVSGCLLHLFILFFLQFIISSQLKADFNFDEMKQLEQAEQDDLLVRAKKAAKNWNFSEAEKFLKQAQQKDFAPDKTRAVSNLIASQRKAKAAKEQREAGISQQKTP